MEMANLNKELMKVQVDARPMIKEYEGRVAMLGTKVEAAKTQRDIEVKNVSRLETFLVNEKARIRKV